MENGPEDAEWSPTPVTVTDVERTIDVEVTNSLPISVEVANTGPIDVIIANSHPIDVTGSGPINVATASGQPLEVRITDIDISFGSMVWLLIQLAAAAIPAAIVLGIALKLLELLAAFLPRIS